MSGNNSQNADQTPPPTPHPHDNNMQTLNDEVTGILSKLMLSLNGITHNSRSSTMRGAPADPVVSKDVVAQGSMWNPEDDEFTGMMSQHETVRSDSRGTIRAGAGKAVQKVASSNMWDPDDDEFDRWPGQKTIDRIATAYMKPRGTSNGTGRDASRAAALTQNDSGNSTSSLDSGKGKGKAIQAITGANLTEKEHDDLWNDLQDMECGNPDGTDVHDEVMRQFYLDLHPNLPASLPARYMHIIGHKAYSKSSDSIVKLAMPRLCDAVATVLYYTHPKCLEEFLSPDVYRFEWHHQGDCAMIRREGNVVTVGTYHNFGTTYVWTYFVRSTISYAGAWTDNYAAVSLITTPISQDGVEFEQSYAEPSAHGLSPIDPKYALCQGRDLALFLLIHRVWDYRLHFRWPITWESDGVVTNAKVLDPLQMGASQETDDD